MILRISSVKQQRLVPDQSVYPVWIVGMFRSGTTITTRVLQQLGLDLGPEEDLLKGKGVRQQLNPDGFYENYLSMEFSIHLFHQLNAWGDNPPALEQVKRFDLNSVNYKDFVYDAVVNMHDDRISNLNKKRILQEYYPRNMDQYFGGKFQKNFGVKNPHFSLLFPILDQYWPKGRYLVIFRNPVAAVASAKRVTPRANYALYNAYYERLIDHSKASFFSYDQLVTDPVGSIETLKETFGLKGDVALVSQLVKKVRSSYSKTELVPPETKALYERMLQKAINKPVV